MLFSELAKIQKKALSKQPLVTLEEAKEQVAWLKGLEDTKNNTKKQYNLKHKKETR